VALNTTERLKFLLTKFNVFDETFLLSKTKKLENDGYDVSTILSHDDDCLGIVSKKEENGKIRVEINISKTVFDLMVDSDPAPNKMYTQWMLTTFNRMLKEDNYTNAVRFASEDLPLASVYLIIFESNKRKQKFKELCASSFILKGINDPTDINQYKSLSQLFDAVDPFIAKDSSEIESLLYRFVDSKQAEIGVRDRKFTVYIPLTKDASVVFDTFANWCTCKEGNGMFQHYTTNYKTPLSRKSKIYIIINNEFFNGVINDNTLFQIHFESNQIKDRKNTHSNVGIYDTLSSSENVLNFFHDELISLSKDFKNLNKNLYLDNLIKFGFSDSLFEVIEETTPMIIFKDKEVPKMGDVARFKNLQTFEMNNTKLTNIHPSVCSLKNLEVMVLRDNKITTIPSEIGNLKNLIFMNILGNEIIEIPDTIKYLDKSNGGNLHRLAVSEKDIGENNYKKLKKLLPNTILN
jgi:hypothetical protein